MTDAFGWVALGAVAGMVIGLLLAASIAQRFLLLGREERDRYQALDPKDTAGRLPGEDVELGEDTSPVGESSGPRHALRPGQVPSPWIAPEDMPGSDPWPAEDRDSTERFEAVTP